MTDRMLQRASLPLLVLAIGGGTATHLIEVYALGETGQTPPLELAALATIAAMGAFLIRRVPRNAIGWLFLGGTVLVMVAGVGAGYAAYGATQRPDLPALAWIGLLSVASVLPAMAVILVYPLLLFPSGLPPGRFWHGFSRSVAAVTVVGTMAVSVWPGALEDQDIPLANPIGIKAIGDAAELVGLVSMGLLLLAMCVSATSLFLRYRRTDDEVRHQLKWVAYAGVLWIVGFGLLVLVPPFQTDIFLAILFLVMTSAMAVAVLKYRLYDIDVVISKTVVFAGLAAFITAIYVGIVVGVGSLLGAGGEPNLALSIVATAVVAVAFQPVRERLTRLANRLVFGRRATPYEVLSRFSEHLGEVAAPEQTLERMAKLLADGTGAARAQVWLRVGDELRPAATWPAHMTDEAQPDHRVEVIHEGELLGALSLDKQRGETLTPTDQKLVDDLAAQAGLVLRNLRLTEQLKAKIVDLQASRQRLVAAQDQERRRLERDLHDGAQRQLLELKSRLALAGSTAAEEQADKAAQVLEQVAGDADDAITTLRELAHGIFPPLLAAEGLAGALTAQATKAAVPVAVEPDGIGRYPQEVEAAVYFCVLEAVQNAAKYAYPTQVTIRLTERDGQLTFEVFDDGAGFDPTTTPRGHGTTNMTDRLETLDGALHITSEPGRGTVVTGRLSLSGTPHPVELEVST